MPARDKNYSFVVFPFLKTSGDVSIGQLRFRSTDVTDGLSSRQAASVDEIASMLFLKDDLRIRSASYALTPLIDLRHSMADTEHLVNVQAVVAYCYASPRHEFGDLFLSPEHASMVIFTPGEVPVCLVRPDFHVSAVEPRSDMGIDGRMTVEGYEGLYNFKHPFWVAPGSRLYGPIPHVTLNHSQDLSLDLQHAAAARADYRLLGELLRRPNTETSSRIFTAVRWFNAANNETNDRAAAIVNLSIAFEALLKLPRDGKTDRLTDGISLLLGRVPRLDVWARQFYDARSDVAHEGASQRVRFVVSDSQKVSEGPQYQSLLSYGRQVFQLCLATLLVGAELAEKAGLEEKLVTNQERFQKICKVLADETILTRERLELIAPLIAATQRYRFIPESDLQLDTMIGALRRAAKVLLESDAEISPELKEHLERLTSAKPSHDHLEELDALHALESTCADKSIWKEMSCGEAVRDLVTVVWDYVFMHYFWIKGRPSEKPQMASNEKKHGSV